MYEWMVHQGFAANHHCNKIGQIKKDANPATCANDKGYPASRAGNDRYSVFCGVKNRAGKEIWQIVESVIELPQGYIEAENAKREAKQKQPAPQEPKKKERWKKDRPPGSQKDTSKRTEKESEKKVE